MEVRRHSLECVDLRHRHILRPAAVVVLLLYRPVFLQTILPHHRNNSFLQVRAFLPDFRRTSRAETTTSTRTKTLVIVVADGDGVE